MYENYSENTNQDGVCFFKFLFVRRLSKKLWKVIMKMLKEGV
jgi:hypothetical protein